MLPLASDGTYLWTLTFGIEGRAGAHRVEVDTAGNILMVGNCDGWLDLNVGRGVHERPCWLDICVIKLSPMGPTYGRTSSAVPRLTALQGSPSILRTTSTFTGTFQGTVDFDPRDGVGGHTARAQFDDLFITKFDADGSNASLRCETVIQRPSGKRVPVAGAEPTPLSDHKRRTASPSPGASDERPSACLLRLL